MGLGVGLRLACVDLELRLEVLEPLNAACDDGGNVQVVQRRAVRLGQRPAEAQPRCTGDTREIRGRYQEDTREIRARYDGDIPVATRVVRARVRARVRVRLTLTLTLTKTYQLPPAWRRVVRRRSASSATTAWQIEGRCEGDLREISGGSKNSEA